MSWPGGDHTAQARDAARRVDLFFAHGPAVSAWAAGLGLGGRLREGRSPVEGLSARPWPGLAWPRLTFTGRFRADKAPDVLVEALALLDAPPPAYLVGDGPHAPGADPADPGPRAADGGAPSRLVLSAVPLRRGGHRPCRALTGGVVVAKRGGGARARRPGRRHRGRWPGAHPGRRPRRPGPARATRPPSQTRWAASWADSAPTPAQAGPMHGSSPPAPRPRCTSTPTATCSPAAPDSATPRQRPPRRPARQHQLTRRPEPTIK